MSGESPLTGPFEALAGALRGLVPAKHEAAMLEAVARCAGDVEREMPEGHWERDLQALIEMSPVAVAVWEAGDSRAVLSNREARRLIEYVGGPGCTLEALLEKARYTTLDGEEVALADEPVVQRMAAGGEQRALEVELYVPGGPRLPLLVNVTPVYGADGSLQSVVAAYQDLTPFKEMERLRAQFLGLVSHELRAPLMAIQGAAVALLDRDAPPGAAELREYGRIVSEHATKMRGLIGELLDAGHIEAGTLTVLAEPIRVEELVREAVAAFAGGGAPHEVEVSLATALPPVMAERTRIVQVLYNLLSNGAAGTPPGHPLKVEAAREGAHVAVSVTDGGRRLTAQRVASLFRADPAEGPGSGGGLGLAICRGLVEAHGGRLRSEDAGSGDGARFTFTLPVAAGPDAGAGAGAAPEEAAAPILVVDDDPLVLSYVRDALNGAGYRVVATGDPDAIGALIRREAPQAVLLDLMLPGAEGIGLMQSVPELSEAPVIFISVYGRDETIARALKAGAADYVVKPFTATELVARLEAALRGRADPEPFAAGALRIDYARRRVTMGAAAVALTPTEYELLRVLSLNAGRVVSYAALVRQVWPERKNGGAPVVRAFMQQLRAKLGEDAEDPELIFTHRGVGYRMRESARR